MAKQLQSDPPKVFISYAWKNQPIAKKLQRDLQRDGVEVFVDYEKITGGDSLPARISAALDWCNTLILLWSAEADQSYYVSQEWESAFHLQKRIIPCVLDGTALPALLRSRLYLNFSSYQDGYAQLCRTLGVEPTVTMTPSPALAPEILVPPQHVDLRPGIPADFQKPPKAEARVTIKEPPALQLRNQPTTLLPEQVKAMLKRYDFYCHEYGWNKDWSNPQGKGIDNKFEIQQEGKVVVDRATGLMWQQSGSPEYMDYANAEKYIRDLNNQRFASYNDWRLPTLEEAMSLMESKKHGNLYIDPLFDQTQMWIWTADKESAGVAWVVYFGNGSCHRNDVDFRSHYVRAVRGGQSSI
jgi:hypothetical protein